MRSELAPMAVVMLPSDNVTLVILALVDDSRMVGEVECGRVTYNADRTVTQFSQLYRQLAGL